MGCVDFGMCGKLICCELHESELTVYAFGSMYVCSDFVEDCVYRDIEILFVCPCLLHACSSPESQGNVKQWTGWRKFAIWC